TQRQAGSRGGLGSPGDPILICKRALFGEPYGRGATSSPPWYSNGGDDGDDASRRDDRSADDSWNRYPCEFLSKPPERGDLILQAWRVRLRMRSGIYSRVSSG